MDALIGHTGFVGTHLMHQHQFSACFNSANITQIDSSSYDLTVCAAAPGSMLEANTAPDQDAAKIDALIEQLEKVKTKRFVLISSIAVLSNFSGRDDEHTSAFQESRAYGKHRRKLEVFCQNHFEDCLILRLPALFGTGLRKNYIFDLLNPVPSYLNISRFESLLDFLSAQSQNILHSIYRKDAALNMWKLDPDALRAQKDREAFTFEVVNSGYAAMSFHNPNTTYQYYDMRRLWSDQKTAYAHGLQSLHLAMPPLKVAQIYKTLLKEDMPANNAALHQEDMHTCHASLFDMSGPYLDQSENVLQNLKAFFDREMNAK